MQKLLRYKASGGSVVTTDDMPHSPGVSDDPVNSTSPRVRRRWRSTAPTLTKSSGVTSVAMLRYTFMYETNRAPPTWKSAFDFPVSPPNREPTSPNVTHLTLSRRDRRTRATSRGSARTAADGSSCTSTRRLFRSSHVGNDVIVRCSLDRRRSHRWRCAAPAGGRRSQRSRRSALRCRLLRSCPLARRTT